MLAALTEIKAGANPVAPPHANGTLCDAVVLVARLLQRGHLWTFAASQILSALSVEPDKIYDYTLQTKMAGIAPGHFHFSVSPYRGGAVPGGGGGSEAWPPLSSGVMRRTVTRRLIRLGPCVCSFRYCSP